MAMAGPGRRAGAGGADASVASDVRRGLYVSLTSDGDGCVVTCAGWAWATGWAGGADASVASDVRRGLYVSLTSDGDGCVVTCAGWAWATGWGRRADASVASDVRRGLYVSLTSDGDGCVVTCAGWAWATGWAGGADASVASDVRRGLYVSLTSDGDGCVVTCAGWAWATGWGRRCRCAGPGRRAGAGGADASVASDVRRGLYVSLTSDGDGCVVTCAGWAWATGWAGGADASVASDVRRGLLGLGDGLGPAVPMRLSRLTFGADSGCDVVLDPAQCRYVSPRHATVFYDEAALLAAPPSPSLSMCLSRVCMWSCCCTMRSTISTHIDSFTVLGLHDKKICTRNDSFTDHGFHDKHIKAEVLFGGCQLFKRIS
ncbi:hypothetical protein MSG28_005988 [Choristoneura fumiferana]|uniref:Uncharacterized protein n=1 Tax=Choristoneura fumiferana TaxID=7141 RepID=A0ACC0L2A8_CHOFU|nr:hypothetical protein MSG28_005988 [Choristoneura fumiferana]